MAGPSAGGPIRFLTGPRAGGKWGRQPPTATSSRHPAGGRTRGAAVPGKGALLAAESRTGGKREAG